MCVLDFVALATSIPGLVPPSTLTKPITEHDFAIRLCKGHADPSFGPNQYGPARYYLPDSSVLGGLVEVVDDPDGYPGRIYFETLLTDLNFEMYVHLEDVWVTLLCPVHVDIVWFVQFWVRNARTKEELEEVTKRVRARRSGDPDFVVRFNEMRGVLNPRPNPPRADPLQTSQHFGGKVGGDVDSLWRNHPDYPRTQFENEGRGEMGPPLGFGLPNDFEQSPSPSQIRIAPAVLPYGQARQFGNDRVDLANPPLRFYKKMYQEGLSGVVVPQHMGELRVICELGSGHPSPFQGVGGGLRDASSAGIKIGRGIGSLSQQQGTSELTMQANTPISGFPPQAPSYEGQPYGVYRPEPPVTPLAYQNPSISDEASAKVDEWWADINSPGGFPSQTSRSHPAASPGFENIRPRNVGPVPRESTPFSRTGPAYRASPPGFENTRPRSVQPGPAPEGSTPFSEPRIPVPESQPAPLRDTSVAGASPWAPPAGNTTGLRPVQRRTWNIDAKEWHTYWVWAL